MPKKGKRKLFSEAHCKGTDTIILRGLQRADVSWPLDYKIQIHGGKRFYNFYSPIFLHLLMHACIYTHIKDY